MATTANSSVFRPDNVNKRVYTSDYGTGGFVGQDKCPQQGGQDGGLGTDGLIFGPPGGGAGGVWKASESRLGVVNGCKAVAGGTSYGGIYIFDDGGTKWILAPFSTEQCACCWQCSPCAVTNANSSIPCGDWFLPNCSAVEKIVAGTSTYWDCVGNARPSPAPGAGYDTTCAYWGTDGILGNGSNQCYWSIYWDAGATTGTTSAYRNDVANTFCAPWARARAFRCI